MKTKISPTVDEIYTQLCTTWYYVLPWFEKKEGKFGAKAMKRVAAGAHLPTPWLFWANCRAWSRNSAPCISNYCTPQKRSSRNESTGWQSDFILWTSAESNFYITRTFFRPWRVRIMWDTYNSHLVIQFFKVTSSLFFMKIKCEIVSMGSPNGIMVPEFLQFHFFENFFMKIKWLSTYRSGVVMWLWCWDVGKLI